MAKKYCKIKRKQRLVEREHTYGEKVYDWCNDRKCKFTAYDESDAELEKSTEIELNESNAC